MEVTRRQLLRLSAGGAAIAAEGCREPAEAIGWNRGPIRHLLPTASDRAFNIKLSLGTASESAPVLHVRKASEAGDREEPLRVNGERQDSRGRFWAFRVGGLAPDTLYSLRLYEAGAAGRERLETLSGAETPAAAPLCDAWPLRTLPAPEARPDHLRIVAFTCAGGPNLPTPPSLFHAFKPTAYRQKLFDRMLERTPDLAIANGDHVYFDLPQMSRARESLLGALAASVVEGIDAIFDPSLPVLGTDNETALTTVGDDQIAGIYGVRFRSTPTFFVTDDHDYFANDDATPEGITLPPDAFHMALRNALQRLYLPEFIVQEEPGQPLPGRFDAGGIALSSHFGEVRYGDLFRGLCYDCSGYLGLEPEAGLVPPAVEAWLLDRTREEDTLHLVHLPSHPVGWTAGKWREWYPDLLESSGSLVAAVGVDEDGNKYAWQPGWWQQHQRLLRALAAQTRREPLVVSGDLHALGIVRIEQSGELDLSESPVHSVLSGPVGVGDIGWPSRARGVDARTPSELRVTELLTLDERNGFTLLDFERRHATIDLLACPPGWTAPEALDVERAARLELG